MVPEEVGLEKDMGTGMWVFKAIFFSSRRSRNYATYLKKKKGVLTFTCPVMLAEKG